MNAITGIENLVKQPGILQCPYFRVYYDKEDDKHRLRDNHHIENCSIEECERLLRSLIDEYRDSGCNFIFWFTTGIGQTALKGGYHIQFYLPAQNGHSNPGIGYLSKEEVMSMNNDAVTKALNDFKLTLRLEQQSKEIAELKKQVRTSQPNGLERVFERMQPLITAIAKKEYGIEMGTQANISGTGDNQNEDEINKTILESLDILNEGEGDIHLILQKLAQMKRENPEKYKIAKSML